MTTIDTLQRRADYWAAKLGVGPVRVDWLDRCPSAADGGRWMSTGESKRFNAHCHTWGSDKGLICVAAHVSRWQDEGVVRRISRLMRHEVAHLVGKGKHGTREFMAAAGEKPRKRRYLSSLPIGKWWPRVQGPIGQEMGKAGIREVVEMRRTA